MKVAVIGGGIAGLWTSLSFRKAKVILIAPKKPSDANTYWAQGGIAAALDPNDSPLVHYEDTLRAGDHFNDKRAALVLTHYGPMVLNKLIQMGFRFNPRPHLEGGHSFPRIWNVGDETGRKLLKFLEGRVEDRVDAYAKEIILEDGKASGVVLEDGREILADAVVLATGGYSALWRRTTNPPETLGRGLLMAAKAGAYLTDLEFVQFHPTVSLTDPPRLLTEALRGAGARIVDEEGKDVINPLLPRDVVARAIYNHRKKYGPVFLDLSKVDINRFPVAKRLYDELGNLIPIAPAAHYSIGGVKTDIWGRTNVRGLWAVGECSSTGVHGANRLASNSLLEALVFGYRVAVDIENDISEWPSFNFLKVYTLDYVEGDEDIDKVKDTLEESAGVERERESLEAGLNALRDAGGVANLARAVLKAALWREESRGVHYRKDYPAKSDLFSGHLGFLFNTIR